MSKMASWALAWGLNRGDQAVGIGKPWYNAWNSFSSIAEGKQEAGLGRLYPWPRAPGQA